MSLSTGKSEIMVANEQKFINVIPFIYLETIFGK